MNNRHHVRGIRGATTAADNIPDDILRSTRELLMEMINANSINTEDIAAVFFSATPDLDSAFPAKAAREMDWSQVPLFCSVEINVPDSLSQCIRVMMLVNTGLGQGQIKHIYLKDTARLRDL